MRYLIRTKLIPGLAVPCLLAFAGCSDSPPDAVLAPESPIPGTAAVSLTANPDGVAAFTFAITGGEVDDVRSSGDVLLYWETVSGTTRVVAIYPRPASGPLFTVYVPDTRVLDRYVVRVEQAANTLNDPVDAGSLSVELQ